MLSRVHPHDRWKYVCAAWIVVLAAPALGLGMLAGKLYNEAYLPLRLAASPPTVITKLVPVPAPSPITHMTTAPDAGERPVLVGPVGRGPVSHFSAPRTTPPAVPVAPPRPKVAREAPSTTSTAGPTVSRTSAPTSSPGPTPTTSDVPSTSNPPMDHGRLQRTPGL